MPMTAEAAIDDLTIELDAMQTIARALATVHDPDARVRILRWAKARFGAAPDLAAAATLAGAADASTAAEPPASAHLLLPFGDDGVEAQVEAAPAPVGPSFEPMLRGSVTDFRALALQWQRA